MKPLEWTEVDAGKFRATGYGVEIKDGAWQVWRLHKATWYSMGREPTLSLAKKSCTRHRRTNRTLGKEGGQ